MTPRLNQQEFELFRKYIEKMCGISLTDDKKYLVETRLTNLVFESGAKSFSEFYTQLDRSPSPQMRSKIIDAMTTNETLWFRDGSPWVALRDHILPDLEKRKGGQRIRIWSAACSTGQEPYTISMIVDDFCRPEKRRKMRPEDVEVVATDISNAALFVGKMGRYDRISMNRGFTGEWAPYKARYFSSKGAVSLIDPKLKSRVQFKQFNLQDSFSPLGRFDVVFLRNVAIYFSEDFKKDLFNKIANMLNPGGLLVLGSAETTHGYSTRFKSTTFGRAMAYQVG